MPVTSKRRRTAKLALLAMTAGILALTSACSGKTEPPAATQATVPPATTPVPVPSLEPSPTPETPAFTAPLTGLPVEQAIKQRPFAVVINNLKPARPQSGLTQADVVWEFLAEGGITRFLAIFQSKEFTDPIGPVRSIRPYFIELGDLYGAVHVHAGSSNDAYAILRGKKKQDLDEITNAGAFFWRDKSRKAPHNVYTNLDQLRKGAEKLKYPLEGQVPAMKFGDAPDTAGASNAAEVEIRFQLSSYKVSYRYDPVKEAYVRFINDEPHIDKNNNEQLSAVNLVVLATKHRAYDKEGRLEVDLESGGDAVLIQQGKAVFGQWAREGGMIRILKDGKELPFLPGVTYYHVVPNQEDLAKHVTIQ